MFNYFLITFSSDLTCNIKILQVRNSECVWGGGISKQSILYTNKPFKIFYQNRSFNKKCIVLNSWRTHLNRNIILLLHTGFLKKVYCRSYKIHFHVKALKDLLFVSN